MDEFLGYINSAIQWLLVPTAIYGAAGGALRAKYQGEPWQRIIIKGIGGAIVANLCAPICAELPPIFYNFAIFFCGWGGLELVGKLYDAFARLFINFFVNGLGNNADK